MTVRLESKMKSEMHSECNDLCLNNLALVSEKQCYAIKDVSSDINESNSSCNKSLPTQNIILSYIKKFTQRKEALIKIV